jgi:hypothetical protein
MIIEKIKSINNSKDLEALKDINLDQVMLELATQKNYESQDLLNNQSIISFILKVSSDKKLVLFIFNKTIKNVHFPFKGPIKLLIGSIDLEIKHANEIKEIFDWLKEPNYEEIVHKSLKNNDYYDYHVGNGSYIVLNIQEPGTVFIQLIPNNKDEKLINIDNFLYKPTELSNKNRRLIKLSKNYYTNESSRESAKENFYKVLQDFSDQQIFQAYFIEKYAHSIREMREDFESFMRNRYRDIYFKRAN